MTMMAEIDQDESLTQDQLALLRLISDTFSPQDSAADLAILLEVTGFKGQCDNFSFWDEYDDFEDLVSLARNEEVRKKKDYDDGEV